MRPLRRLTTLAARPHLPRRTVRLRLTLVYGGLFLVSGAALLAITYALVVHATEGIVFKSGNLSGFIVGSRTPSGPAQTVQTGQAQNGPIQTGPSAGRPPTLTPQLAKQLADRQHAAELRQLLLQSGIALAGMAVISIALGWAVSGRVLRPLRTITTAVRDISATNLHERLALAGPDDELKELGDTFNALLARLDDSFQAQRRFVANASHELRTPLARQRALGQVAIDDPDATPESLRAAHQRVLAAGAQQERLIDALLTLARGQTGINRYERIDLASVTNQVIADRRAEASRYGIDVRTTISPAPMSGDARLVERLVANLLDNAMRHNVARGFVDIATGRRADQSVLVVENSGPKIAATDIDQLFQPFRRLQPDRTGGGVGLGLSIVSAVADAHGAVIRASSRPEGGLRIEVAFAGVAPDRDDGAAAGPAARPRTGQTLLSSAR